MEDPMLYEAYQRFYERYRGILKITITRDGTTLKITRRRDRILVSMKQLSQGSFSFELGIQGTLDGSAGN
jgi:hypothetical protein